MQSLSKESAARAEQIKNMRFGMFICWSFSTFSGQEWTPTLDKDAGFFPAQNADTDQWCATAKAAGMNYILFLTKHHDGFCLWDTATTDKKVTNSPLGIDLLAKVRQSCDAHGLKLALYFSEGDWNWPDAEDGEAYKGGHNPEVKKAQLQELCTNYGPIEFFWMDHAVGDGGLSHAKTAEFVRELQPDCFVGFNNGEAAGRLLIREMGKPGPLDEPQKGYLAAEFTYPILPDCEGGAMWFYSLPKHDNLCQKAEDIYNDYLGAVKHGNIFSLNIGPNYEGKLRQIDVETLKQVGEQIRKHEASETATNKAKIKQRPALRAGGGEANPNLHTHAEALKAFRDKRFGMFIHWGPVTLRGEELSWSRGNEIAADEYDQLYKDFHPSLFSAKEWVTAAKNAGMKYIVITTRHHDGFCLWDSQHSDYTMAITPYGKGIVGELADECRKQGLDFGAYYSILDWWHPDYPVTQPTGYKLDKEQMADPAIQAKMARYTAYMKSQLKELIDNYDPVLIWFDGEWEWPWTHEMGMELYAYLRNLKDALLINNRVDKGREGMTGLTKSSVFAGDYATPEQCIGAFDNQNAWETCMTIGDQWSWKPNDKIKSKKKCIETLLQTIGGDGNLLLNIGPMPDGRIERRQIERLQDIGDWLTVNSEAVYGTRGGPYLPTSYMVSTQKQHKVYLHLLEHPGKNWQLPFPQDVGVQKVYFLDGGQTVPCDQNEGKLHFSLPSALPDPIASVLVLDTDVATIDVIERVRY